MVHPHKFFIFFAVIAVFTLGFVSKEKVTVDAQSADEVAEIYNWVESQNLDPSTEVGSILFNYKNCDTNNDGVRDNIDAKCDGVEEAIANQYQVKVNFSSINPARQILSGNAYNSKLGRITFNIAELSGCPSGLCQAYINEDNGTLNGWAKVVRAIDWHPPRFGPEFNDETNGAGDYQFQGLDASNNLLYLGGAKKNSPYNAFFSIFDVSDRDNPVQLSHTDLLESGVPCSSSSQCDSTNVRYVEWGGMNLVFISQYKFGFFVYEVSDPENPVLMGYKYFPDSSTEAWESLVYGNFGYVSGYFYGTGVCTNPGLAYFDMNDLTPNPVSELTFNYPASGCASNTWQDIVTYDNYLISAERNSGVKVYDLIDPENPFLVQTVSSGFDSNSWAYGLFKYGSSIYIIKSGVTASGDDQLIIAPLLSTYPVINTNATVVQDIASDASFSASQARTVFVNESNGQKYAYVGSDIGGVNIYDVTNTSNIDKIIQMVSTYNKSPYYGQTFELAYTNGTLFSGVDLSSLSTNKNLKAYSLIKAETADQWINLSRSRPDGDNNYISPSAFYNTSTYEISGEVDGRNIMKEITIPNDEKLYVSRAPTVDFTISPNPADSGLTRTVSWTASQNSKRCYTAGGDATWDNLWDFDIDPLVTFSGNVTVGPVQNVGDPDNTIRLICADKFGNTTEVTKTIIVNGSNPDNIPKCGDATLVPRALEPQTDLCSVGTPSSVTLLNNYWRWTCISVDPEIEPKLCQVQKKNIKILDI